MRRDTDILIVGAGPAGMAAAIAIGASASCTVLDDNAAAGGQIWRAGVLPGRGGGETVQRKEFAAFRASGATLLAGRRVIDAPRAGELRALVDDAHGSRIETFRYRKLIVATGARERFLPFPGWTLPGVFGVGGLQALVKGGYDLVGKRVVVAGTGPLLLAVATHLREVGAKIVCIAEQAPLGRLIPFAASLWAHPGKLWQGVRYRAALRSAPYRTGCWVRSARGSGSITEVEMMDGSRTWVESCDALACGFHLVPNTELAMLLGCRMEGDAVSVDADQQTSVERVYCVGEPTAVAGLDAGMLEGRIAGLHAIGSAVDAASLRGKRDREKSFGTRLERAFELRPEVLALAAPDTLVCRCEDVPFGHLQGRYSWTDAKLQTRCGMGPCQGRICGPATQALFGWRNVSIRPPLFPVPLEAFCSLSEEPVPQEIA